jgi:hypothetical protein
MKPNLLRWLAIAMSAANQDSVSHDAPCARFSFLQASAAALGHLTVSLPLRTLLAARQEVQRRATFPSEPRGHRFMAPVTCRMARPQAMMNGCLLQQGVHHSTTPVMSRMARPSSAAATALTPIAPPKIHRPTVIAKAKAVIFSSVDSGPARRQGHRCVTLSSTHSPAARGCLQA